HLTIVFDCPLTSTLCHTFFFFYSYVHPRDLHSFPTRRSSDLRMMPGATVLTRMPRAAYSMARDRVTAFRPPLVREARAEGTLALDRKSTRLNSSHRTISYAVFCLKKKKKKKNYIT